MKNHTLYIKNMVCRRCVLSVKDVLDRLSIAHHSVELGEAQLCDPLSGEQLKALEKELHNLGFEIIDNRQTAIIEKTKKAILEYLHLPEDQKRMKLSSFLSSALNYEYTYLSNLYSSIEGITIEQYFILQRIEKVKELLVYDQLSLSEIAFQMGYSSVHHLSAQFSKTTGLTPSHFKKIGASKRKSIDQVGTFPQS